MKNLGITFIMAFLLVPTISKADTVSLNYNWEPGIVSNVKYNFSKTRNHAGQNQERNVSGSYMFKTKRYKDGLQVDFYDHKTEVSMKNERDKNKLQKFMKKISEITPSYILNKKGELVEVVGIAELKTTMQEEFKSISKENPPEVQQKINQIMNKLFSESQIMAQLQQEWNRNVGQWIGAKFDEGAVYEIEFSSQIPFLGNKSVLTKGKYEYLGKTKCYSDAKEEKCVKLKYESSLNQEATTAVIKEMFKTMGVEVPESFKLKSNYLLELITDPTSLRPYQLDEIKKVTTPNRDGSEPISQTDKKHYSFTYVQE